jgi:hypothetical protein
VTLIDKAEVLPTAEKMIVASVNRVAKKAFKDDQEVKFCCF